MTINWTEALDKPLRDMKVLRGGEVPGPQARQGSRRRPALNGLHITSGGSEGRASPRAGRECCWPSIPRPPTAWCRFALHLRICLRHPTAVASLQPGLVLTGEITWIKCPRCEQVRAEGRAPRLPSLLLAHVSSKLVRKSTN